METGRRLLRMLRSIKKWLIASTVAVAMMGSSGLYLNPSSALSGADWNAAKIMSDDLFFKPDSMSTGDIQFFLNSMVPSCDTQGTQPYGGTTAAAYGTARGYPPPYTCLKDYVENPDTRQNNANGGAVTGGISAAQIIKNASDTYGISPKVLIVLLQKEQSLVTDDWPWTLQYRAATGYGCPDTAPCDAEYYGFYNQVTKAAFQFKRYAQFPNDYRYKAFQSNFIQWHPNASCGGTNVNISNQTTAGLYNYTPYQPNARALSNIYGSQDDGCSSYGNRNFWRLYNDWFGPTQYEENYLTYKSHVSYLGWTENNTNSSTTGTTGQGRTMQAFRINGAVEYTSYNQTTGWQPTVSGGMISGTTGMGRAIQAIKINPLGNLANRYDLYYRAHLSNVGWMGWAKNGQPAGITGGQNNIEAIELRLVPKDTAFIGSTANAYQNIGTITYSPQVALSLAAHIGGIGWQPTVTDTMVSGTTEQGRRIEAIKIALSNTTGLTGGVTYSAHVSGIGWQDFKLNNDTAGTTGQAKQMEAIRIALTGPLGDSYDIWYRGYVQNKGWLGWTKNGYPAGSMGAGLQLEAVETRVVAKNSGGLADNGSFFNPSNASFPETYFIGYATHLSNLGWVNNIKQNETGGTTGQRRSMEAIRFDNLSSVLGAGSIKCAAYVRSTGWVEDVAQSSVCGTTGQGKPLESIKLSLSGEVATKYDIQYRVHVSNIGWLDWTENGEQAGNPSSNNSIEAIIIRLVQK